MTDELMLALFCVLPIVLLALAVTLTHRVDSKRTDWVAKRHRDISHRGFKSRAGIRS